MACTEGAQRNKGTQRERITELILALELTDRDFIRCILLIGFVEVWREGYLVCEGC